MYSLHRGAALHSGGQLEHKVCAPWLTHAAPSPLRECINPFTRKSLYILSLHRNMAAVNGIWGSAIIDAVFCIVLVIEKEEIDMVSDS
jgi:hypothetical protein